MDLLEARKVVHEVTSQLHQNSFQERLQSSLSSLGPSASDVDKNAVLQDILLDVWRSVLGPLGFEGDEGDANKLVWLTQLFQLNMLCQFHRLRHISSCFSPAQFRL